MIFPPPVRFQLQDLARRQIKVKGEQFRKLGDGKGLTLTV